MVINTDLHTKEETLEYLSTLYPLTFFLLNAIMILDFISILIISSIIIMINYYNKRQKELFKLLVSMIFTR